MKILKLIFLAIGIILLYLAVFVIWWGNQQIQDLKNSPKPVYEYTDLYGVYGIADHCFDNKEDIPVCVINNKRRRVISYEIIERGE